MKKAQGLSINTIILIVLGLIILVVLAFVLGGKFIDFGRGASSAQCPSNVCVAQASECGGEVPIPTSNCGGDPDKSFCCNPLT